MEFLLPRPRTKRKQGRSQSLPARLGPVFRAKTEEIPRKGKSRPGSNNQAQAGDTTYVWQTVNETQPQSRLFDDWSHLEPDECGAELAREARVWKVYVGESDKWDKELIEGWEKSMDVLLVFAALFSAISAAFLIESSKMLKQDPADVPVATLLVISQTLVALATGGSPENSTTLSQLEQGNASEFVPTHNAVVVNTLWYMSLSLSIATAFLAMLAKDWCHSFLAHRTGHPRDQAHRRQRKWKLIERWKMEELILVLPSLMHLSLLLFAIGLCVYLWDLNHTTAIPVICIAGGFLLFYVWSSITASIVESFPYTTIVSRIMRSNSMRVIYPPITKFGSHITYLLGLVFVGIIFLYTGILFVLFLVVVAVWVLILAFDRYVLRWFVKTRRDLDRLASSALDNTYHLTMTLADFPFRILSGISSRLTSATKSLELTDDLTTSLALSWLIQHCETPSAIDIALQAIAGASQRVPKAPLLSSQATEQIMRRIVSHGASVKEMYRNNLYTRSLEFLGLNSMLESVNKRPRLAGDIEVIVWDLKSKNEREIADLIKDGSFIPNENNLEAMRIGNSAASQCLSIWRGEAKNNGQELRSITRILSCHLDSGGQQLHPAAVQSLANAAALHTSLSIISEAPPNYVGLCMEYCDQLIRGKSSNGGSGPAHNLQAAAVFVISVLLQRRPSGPTLPGPTQPVPQLHTRALRAITTLTDLTLEGKRFQVYIVWIGCLEILSNRVSYGLNSWTGRWESLEQWCSQHSSVFVRKWSSPFIPSWELDHHEANLARNSFLKSTSQVYELVLASQPNNLEPTHLPLSLHTILTIIACGNSRDPWQSQTSDELLSKLGFPRISQAFIDSLETPIDRDNKTILSAIATTYCRNLRYQARQHYAATQLWLILDLADGQHSYDQQVLKAHIEHVLEGSLQFQTKGFDQVKKDMEAYIIEGYRREHRISNWVAGGSSRPPPIWDTIKTNLLVWRAGSDSEHSILRLGTRLSALQNPDTDTPGTIGKHQRVYTARVIQRILRKRGLKGNEDLEPLIEADFKELLPCFQSLLPSFTQSPPSSGTHAPQATTLARAEAALTSYSRAESPVADVGHVSVEVQKLVGDPQTEVCESN